MIEEKLVARLKEKKLVITTAESCTAGLVAATLVNVSGASGVFKEGYITYCDAAKRDILGVSEATLAEYYAVSEQTAKEMAAKGAEKTGADVCIAVTGVAGPDMEDGKPVGLVYVACYYDGKVTVREFNFTGDRQCIRDKSAKAALELALDVIG